MWDNIWIAPDFHIVNFSNINIKLLQDLQLSIRWITYKNNVNLENNKKNTNPVASSILKAEKFACYNIPKFQSVTLWS